MLFIRQLKKPRLSYVLPVGEVKLENNAIDDLIIAPLTNFCLNINGNVSVCLYFLICNKYNFVYV